MNPQEVNQLAIWLPMKGDDIAIKVFPEGYPYRRKGMILRSTITQTITRYAKNYIKEKKKFSLCMITEDNNIENVEKWLDHQAATLDVNEIEAKFKKLKVYYNG